jgi:hypothetical protein
MDEIRKKYIIDTIKFFIKNHPLEWEENKKRVRDLRGTRANELGADKALEYRFAFSLHPKLFGMLDETLDNPRFLKEDDEYNWFAKTFRELTIPQKW